MTSSNFNSSVYLRPDDWILRVARSKENAVVNPLGLDELKLASKMRSDKREQLRQRPIISAASNSSSSGDAKPKAVIAGPKTLLGGGGGLVKVYPPTSMIVSSCAKGVICAWSIEDTGDVAPHFKIPVQKITGVNFSRPTLNPTYKEVVVTSGARNIIATFHWPEIFDAKPLGRSGARARLAHPHKGKPIPETSDLDPESVRPFLKLPTRILKLPQDSCSEKVV